MTSEDPRAPGSGATAPQGPAQDSDLLSIDFSTLVLSLATSAMVHMGLAPNPETDVPSEKNLALAHQTIDTLDMLQQKTRGNLDEDEAKLLQSVLYELRMNYVRVSG